jgi:hypothetical protein
MATYSVVGRQGSVLARGQTKEKMNLAVQNNQAASRHTDVKRYDLLQTDAFVRPGNWLHGGEEIEVERTVDLPLPTPYDAISLNATVFIMRRDRGTTEQDLWATGQTWNSTTGQYENVVPAWVADPGIPAIAYYAPILEGSYLSAQMRKRWAVTVYRVLADPAPAYPAGAFIAWRVAPQGSDLFVDAQQVQRDNERAGKRYGMTISDSSLYEVSVHSLGLSKPPKQ